MFFMTKVSIVHKKLTYYTVYMSGERNLVLGD